jgi:hypothetical protein
MITEKINKLARSYNTLGSSTYLRNIVRDIESIYDIHHLSKRDLHNLINDLLVTHSRSEFVMKARLVNLFSEKKVTAAFEMRVHGSRADFLAINGSSKSFEIKSELDNL